MKLEKPYDIESFAWYMHENPHVLMLANESRRLLKYAGIHKDEVHFRANNGTSCGFLMKFTFEKGYSAPIVFYPDRFSRYISPNMLCQYHYISEQEVKRYEWDEFLDAVRGYHEKNTVVQ